MSDYYVFPTEVEGHACVSAINNSGWFPIVGKVKGVDAPDNQKTEKWCVAPIEMLSGEWAVPRIPTARLDALEVPIAERAAFVEQYGQDIRTLTTEDFPAPPED